MLSLAAVHVTQALNHLESFKGLRVLKEMAIQIYYLLSNRIERINYYPKSLDVRIVTGVRFLVGLYPEKCGKHFFPFQVWK
jgi:hypothetical protein